MRSYKPGTPGGGCAVQHFEAANSVLGGCCWLGHDTDLLGHMAPSTQRPTFLGLDPARGQLARLGQSRKGFGEQQSWPGAEAAKTELVLESCRRREGPQRDPSPASLGQTLETLRGRVCRGEAQRAVCVPGWGARATRSPGLATWHLPGGERNSRTPRTEAVVHSEQGARGVGP